MSTRTYLIPTMAQLQPESTPFALLPKMQTVYNGYGTVTYNGNTLTMLPMPSLTPRPLDGGPQETHAALVRSTCQLPPTDYAVSWRGKTVKQLRRNDPANAWEVLWFLWDYVDANHFTYLIVKPNGWEIGRRDPSGNGGQIFLRTKEQELDMVGRTINVDVRRHGTDVEVQAQFADKAWPYFDLIERFDIPTSFTDGLQPSAVETAVYSEDAAVQVTGWAVRY